MVLKSYPETVACYLMRVKCIQYLPRPARLSTMTDGSNSPHCPNVFQIYFVETRQYKLSEN